MGFQSFREYLQTLDIPEYRGTRDEEFVVLKDGTKYSIEEALQKLPPEELDSAGGTNYGFTYPVFLDIYKGNDWRTHCRHIIKARYAIEYEQEQEHAEEVRKQRIKEQFPHARFFVCEFSQDMSGNLYVSHVMSLQGYTDYEQAHKAAERDEKKMYHLKKYDVVMQARLAASFEDAQAGRFLDE